MIPNNGGLLHFSEDDALLAAARGAEVVIMDRLGMTKLRMSRSPSRNGQARVQSVAISDRAGLVAAGYSDDALCVWSLTNCQHTAQREITDSKIEGVSIGILSEETTGGFRMRREGSPFHLLYC